MPVVNIDSIYSVSSEDPAFPASNLLFKTPKKWKSKSTGEKSVIVVLKLQQPLILSGIDVGNENSAFFEVLVGNNGAQPEDFQQILLTSSLMSIMEARSSGTPNRVRCFAKNALVESVACQKWGLVKIVCTQPFNKHVQYGLSFVKLHTLVHDDVNNKDTPFIPTTLSSSSSTFSKFKLREDSPDSDSGTTSLFSRWKQAKNSSNSEQSPLSAAAAIRDSSTPSSLKKFTNMTNRNKITSKPSKIHKLSSNSDDDSTEKPINRNRTALLYDDEDEKPNVKFERKLSQDKERLQKQKDERSKEDKGKTKTETTHNFSDFLDKEQTAKTKTKENPKNHNPTVQKDITTSNLSSSSEETDSARQFKNFFGGTSREKNRKTTSDSSKDSNQKIPIKDDKTASRQKYSPVASTSKKRPSSPMRSESAKKTKKDVVYKPFGKLLEGVVLVISGIQNPDRGILRSKALEMGAKYKPDWDNSCTHLICAFQNTPKYNQVHGYGKIITKDWITKCHSNKKRLPWRRHALDHDETEEIESESEIHDVSLQPIVSLDNPSANQTNKNKKHITDSSDEDSLSRYDLKPATSKSETSRQTDRNEFMSSGSDTEDELEKILKKKQTAVVDIKKHVLDIDDDIYNKTTDDEGLNEKEYNRTDENSLSPLPEFFKNKTFFLAENLSSVDEIKLNRFIPVYMGEVIKTKSAADYIISNSAISINSSDLKGEVVKPLWVFECNSMECLLPTKRYLL